LLDQNLIMTTSCSLAIEVTDFNFAYGSGGVTKEPTAASVLRNVSFSVPLGKKQMRSM
jgi:hypothetical protein